MQEQAAASSKAVNDVKSALETVCEQVSADDPTEEYRDRYRVIGYLKESGRDVITSRVNITIEDGKVSEIFYRGDVDEKVGLSENLDHQIGVFDVANLPALLPVRRIGGACRGG